MNRILLLSLLLSTSLPGTGAQELEISSLHQNGTLTWSGAPLKGTCRIEWAPTATGPWHASWEPLSQISVTNSTMKAEVPMFFRVVCTPPVPISEDRSPAQALQMIEERQEDPRFVILDVRRPDEFAAGHIRDAVNENLQTLDFNARMDAKDKTLTYLVYCRSGGRSAAAVAAMETLGFLEVYNMTGGFTSFQTVEGAEDFIVD